MTAKEVCIFQQRILLYLVLGVVLSCVLVLNYSGSLPSTTVNHVTGPSQDTNYTAVDRKIETRSTAAPRDKSLILFWTFNYFSKKLGLDSDTDINYFECGRYKCGVTKNRTYLKQSHVIIFNPRASKGKGCFSLYILLGANS